jgi:hypothetical protein
VEREETSIARLRHGKDAVALLSEHTLLRNNRGAVVSGIFYGMRFVAAPRLEDYNQAMTCGSCNKRRRLVWVIAIFCIVVDTCNSELQVCNKSDYQSKPRL